MLELEIGVFTDTKTLVNLLRELEVATNNYVDILRDSPELRFGTTMLERTKAVKVVTLNDK